MKIKVYGADWCSDCVTAKNFLDSKGLEKLINRGSNRQIWYLLNFVLWWNEYIQDKDQSATL